MEKRVKIGSIALMGVVVLVGGILFWVNTTSPKKEINEIAYAKTSKVDEKAISEFAADYLQTLFTSGTDEKSKTIRAEKLEKMLDIDESRKELEIASGNHGSKIVTKTKIVSIEEVEKNHYEVTVTLTLPVEEKEIIATYSTVVSTVGGQSPYKIIEGFKDARRKGDTNY